SVFVAAGRGQCQFGRIERALSVQDFEVGRGSTLVTKRGDAHGLLKVGYRVLLAHPDLMELFVADQGVGDVAESTLDGLPVGDERLLVLRLGESKISAQASACKDRLAYLCTVGPNANLRSHEAGEDAAPSKRTAARPCQSDLRKKLS